MQRLVHGRAGARAGADPRRDTEADTDEAETDAGMDGELRWTQMHEADADASPKADAGRKRGRRAPGRPSRKRGREDVFAGGGCDEAAVRGRAGFRRSPKAVVDARGDRRPGAMLVIQRRAEESGRGRRWGERKGDGNQRMEAEKTSSTESGIEGSSEPLPHKWKAEVGADGGEADTGVDARGRHEAGAAAEAELLPWPTREEVRSYGRGGVGRDPRPSRPTAEDWEPLRRPAQKSPEESGANASSGNEGRGRSKREQRETTHAPWPSGEEERERDEACSLEAIVESSELAGC